MELRNKLNKEEEPVMEKTVDNKLEFIQSLIEVKSKIKDSITSDYILAKLNDKDKTGITEMAVGAYLAQRLIKTVSLKAKRWTWIQEMGRRGRWKREELTKEQKEAINQIAVQTFETYMTKLHMTAILNRNQKGNWLLELVGKFGTRPEEEEVAEEPVHKKGIIGRAIDGLMGNQQEEQ